MQSTAVMRLAGTASFLALASPAVAQEIALPAEAPQTAAGQAETSTAAVAPGGGDIIVTAQKRSERLQNVPIAITALSGDQLEQRQIRRVEDLVTSVPNLQVTSPAGEGLPVFALRGISMADYSLSQSSPIAVYFDEVYKGTFSVLGLGMFDLERVEVLRGPQGTLYGKNTTGGAINFISRKPNFETGGNLSVGYGNFDHVMADGALETALGSTLGARVAFTFERAHGWIKNRFPGAPDAESLRQYAIRASLRYQPSDTVDIIIRGSTSLQNPSGYGNVAIVGPGGIGGPVYEEFGIPNDARAGLGRREIDTPDIYRRHLRTYALAANANIQISDALALTSITSWDKGSTRFTEDPEGTPLKQVLALYSGRTEQVTQDLRLASDFSGPFNFLIGAYFSGEKVFNSTSLQFYTDIDVNGDGVINAQDCVDGGGFVACDFSNSFNQKKTSYALYSDATYKLTDRLMLRGGLRYTHDRGRTRNYLAQMRGVDGTRLANLIPGSATDLFATASQDFKGNNVSGRVGVDFKPAPDVLLYANYSRGYRGSAFNAQAFFSPLELSIAKPEKIEAFEGGFKTELFDRLVRFNGAAFWYNYKNQQVLDLNPQTAVQTLINLPKSRIYGVEFDLQIRPTQNLTLSGAFGLTDATVQRGTSLGMDISGNRLISAPVFTLSSSVDWAIPIGSNVIADAHADLSHASGQYYDIVNRKGAFEGAYSLVNARIRFHPQHDRYGMAVWAKNITNEYYRTHRIDLLSSFNYIYTHVNQPRTYGVSFDVKF
jgi:iron complex outermembrane receptor protein